MTDTGMEEEKDVLDRGEQYSHVGQGVEFTPPPIPVWMDEDPWKGGWVAEWGRVGWKLAHLASDVAAALPHWRMLTPLKQALWSYAIAQYRRWYPPPGS